jgi:hypothetical protein
MLQLMDTGASSLNVRQMASSGPAAAGVDEDLLDAREIDKVLSETAQMAGRWGLFRKFLFERLEEVRQSISIS